MDGSMFIGTWWSLVPPLLAIALGMQAAGIVAVRRMLAVEVG